VAENFFGMHVWMGRSKVSNHSLLCSHALSRILDPGVHARMARSDSLHVAESWIIDQGPDCTVVGKAGRRSIGANLKGRREIGIIAAFHTGRIFNDRSQKMALRRSSQETEDSACNVGESSV
jgi:hypothetical protein